MTGGANTQKLLGFQRVNVNTGLCARDNQSILIEKRFFHSSDLYGSFIYIYVELRNLTLSQNIWPHCCQKRNLTVNWFLGYCSPHLDVLAGAIIVLSCPFRSGWEWKSMSHFRHNLWTHVEHWAWTEETPQMLQVSTDTKKKKVLKDNYNKLVPGWIPVLKLAEIWHTLLGFLYFVSLVIGFGGVVVKEVIAGVTQRLIVTRWTKHIWRTTTEVTVTRCRRFWRKRERFLLVYIIINKNKINSVNCFYHTVMKKNVQKTCRPLKTCRAGCKGWWQLTCRWFQGLSCRDLGGVRWRRQNLEFVSLLLLCRQDNRSVTLHLILNKPAFKHLKQ